MHQKWRGQMILWEMNNKVWEQLPKETQTQCRKLIADLLVKDAPLTATRVGGKVIPKVIDEIPILAVMASQAEGVTEIHDATELRHKESDRIKTVTENLMTMGVDIEVFEDGMAVKGPTRLKSAAVQSFGDHRIAMAFTIAGMVAEGETTIADAGCAEISFPGFFSLLEEVAGN